MIKWLFYIVILFFPLWWDIDDIDTPGEGCLLGQRCLESDETAATWGEHLSCWSHHWSMPTLGFFEVHPVILSDRLQVFWRSILMIYIWWTSKWNSEGSVSRLVHIGILWNSGIGTPVSLRPGVTVAPRKWLATGAEFVERRCGWRTGGRFCWELGKLDHALSCWICSNKWWSFKPPCF